MNAFRRFIIMSVLCAMAYAAHCQQMSAESIGPEPKFIDNIPADQHHKGEFIQRISIVPVVEFFVPAYADGNENNADTDNTVGANDSSVTAEAEFADVKDSFVAVSREPVFSITDASAIMPMLSIPDDIVDPVINRYAEMINIDAHDIDNYPLYKFIDQWYGTRYRWGGDDNAGIDCSAFSQKLYGAVYGKEIERTSRKQHKHCERVRSINNAEEGDLIFFRIRRFRISHVGVYLTNGYFVHASRSQGVVISNLDNKYWRRRYAGCGRVEREDVAIYESTMSK